jgi:RNA polymerase sporulation-specific sigma factor
MGIFSMIMHLVYLILGVEATQKFPSALSREEEKECFEKCKKGDEKAREKLINHNLRLVAHIVRKYYTASKNTEDLISVGTIGLIKAIDSFNDENGARFATYGAKCIQNEILMLFRSQKKLGCEVSLNDTIDIDKDGNSLTYIDIISTDDTIAEDIDKKIKINKALTYIKEHLSDREKQIIIMRYGLGGTQAYAQREVAEKLGISRSYVSRIEKYALEKINKYLLPDD